METEYSDFFWKFDYEVGQWLREIFIQCGRVCLFFWFLVFSGFVCVCVFVSWKVLEMFKRLIRKNPKENELKTQAEEGIIK